MSESSCRPSPSTGAQPVRASLKAGRNWLRSRGPYTDAGRTIVNGTPDARTASSPASLLRPYGVTGPQVEASATGVPRRAGPAAASEDVYTRRATPALLAAAATRSVPSRLTRMKAASPPPDAV